MKTIWILLIAYTIIWFLAFLALHTRANASDMDCFNLQVAQSTARSSRAKDMPKYYKAKQAIKELSLFCKN